MAIELSPCKYVDDEKALPCPRSAGKLAILVYDFRGSGVVRNALRIAAAASKEGLDVSLWPIRPQGDMAAIVPAGVPIFPVRHRETRRQRDLDSLLSVPALQRAIDERQPDVLLSGGNHTHLHAALALKLARHRHVRFLGRASNAVVSAAPMRALLRRAIRPFERFQYGAMDRIIAVSHELAGALVDKIGIDRRKIRTIPNGVDAARVEAAAGAPIGHRFFAPSGPPVLVSIGRLSRQKNFEGLLRAFARARRQRPMRLLILGAGSGRRRRRLLTLASRLGVAADFALEDFVPNPFPYIARADLFVLNSRWEGASNVLLEALACGCPIVASRAPTGIAELLLDGRLAPLVPVGDDDALAMAILDRLSQPRDAESLKARAVEHDLDRTLAAYLEVLADEARSDAKRISEGEYA